MLTSCRLRPAYAADIPAMGALWRQVFGDSEEVTDAFYRAFPRCRAAMAENGAGEIISVVHTLPQTLVFPGGTLPVAYLYAIATRKDCRGQGVGRVLVEDSLAACGALGFRLLQFNAVVASNHTARHLYERLGFVPLGIIPGGFRMKDGHYEDICPYYCVL